MTPDEFVRIELTPETRLHIQWLLDNYETADGTSLPRCALYDHYKKHCHEHKLDAVNAASFGKLIRSVFNGLRTRRLGTRGNSKYHYYGIRIKADSPLMQAHVPERYSPHEASAPMSRPSPAPRQSPNAPPPSAVNGHSRGEASDTDRLSLGTGEVPFIQTPQTDGLIEALPKLGLELSHVVMFVNAYNHNCSEVLYCVKQLQFEQIEEYWTAFWQPEDDLDDEDKALGQARLSQQQLFSLCTLPQIQHWVVSLDLAFYQTLVDILVPDVLMSNMSPFLTQSCRNFAKNVEHYLKKAMQGAPEIIQKKKIQAVKYMAQGLRRCSAASPDFPPQKKFNQFRYTSLNHLAQAARAVLQKPDQVTAMYNDYVRILTSVDQALVIPYQCLIDTDRSIATCISHKCDWAYH
ncbi:RFX DNA-binding domain protein [Ancylostoma ceylanicum]|uniref:RFX DNA-binding domain protein n=1 Tax=Ancylostoma ceylanicum TaxID=53326 RepID=A0A0D6MCK9_9BILA|nr:RFX DNA-binding domain protein [Ancylostoma ceylanicum]